MSSSLRLSWSLPLLLSTVACVGSGSANGKDGTGGSGGGGASVTCKRPEGMPAVTLTYDDTLPSQLTTAAPSLKAHGLKATFFLTDARANPAPWTALLADGHELASHTFKHPCPKVNTWVAPGNANEDYDQARMATELDENIAMLASVGLYTLASSRGASPVTSVVVVGVLVLIATFLVSWHLPPDPDPID